MAYSSPYQPQFENNDIKRMGMQAGRTVLEKTIIYGAQLIKFVVLFVIEALKAVLGRR